MGDPKEKLSQQAAFTRHAEWFAAFLSHTDQKRTTQQAILTGLQERPIWRRIMDPQSLLNLYFVGVGTGGLEVPLTKHFGDLRGMDNIAVRCLDPSQEMKDGFMQAATAAGLQDVISDYTLSIFESDKYQAPDRWAHLAVASHAWYYVNGWRREPKPTNSLAKFARSITPGGVGLITLQSERSDNFAIRTIYSPKIHGTQELAGEEVATELEKLGIKHQTAIIDSHTDVKDCFPDGTFNPNEEGERLLSFILRSNWGGLDGDTQEGVAQQLSQITSTNGKPEMVFRDSYIWIPGQPVI